MLKKKKWETTIVIYGFKGYCTVVLKSFYTFTCLDIKTNVFTKNIQMPFQASTKYYKNSHSCCWAEIQNWYFVNMSGFDS